MTNKINSKNKIESKISELKTRLDELENIEWMIEGAFRDNLEDRQNELKSQIELLKNVK